MPLADALALDRLGIDRRDAYGTVRLWMSAAFAVGAIAWGAALAHLGLGVMIPGYALLTGLNALLVVAVFRGRWPWPLRTGRAPRATSLGAAPAVVLFLVALFLVFAPYAATYNFAAVQLAAVGGGVLFVGLAAGLQAAAEIPAMVATSRYAHRLRPALLFGAGAAFYVLVYLVWSLVEVPALLAASASSPASASG